LKKAAQSFFAPLFFGALMISFRIERGLELLVPGVTLAEN
jgi:hypothetical protein